MNGRGPSQIADQLERTRYHTYRIQKQARCENTAHRAENPYRWHESTVVNILERKSTLAQRSI
ncbi:MAG: hypothetical protein ACLRWH_10740 [Emergencia sp.]